MAPTRSIADVDPVFVEICKAVYGDSVDVREVWDICKMGDSSEVHAVGAGPVPPQRRKLKKLSRIDLADKQVHAASDRYGPPPTRVRKAQGPDDDKGKKALAGGLLFGTAAEGAATAAAASKLRGPTYTALHAAPTALTPVTTALKVGAHSKTGRAAELGLQAVNMGVGLAAARELVKKPKQPVSKAKFRHFAPEVLHIADARARRNGLRLIGASATLAGGGAGYAAGRHLSPRPAPSPEPVTKSARHRVRQAENIGGATAGAAGAAFGAAKIRDAVQDEHPDRFGNFLTRVYHGQQALGHSPAKAVKTTKFIATAKPGLKPLLVGTAGGAVAAGAHNLGQHMDRKAHRKQAAGLLAKSSLEFTGVISKVDTEKRQVFGWASLSVVDGMPVLDLQDDYVAIEEIEKSAYTYVLESRKGGDMHEQVSKFAKVPKHTSDLIESVVITPEKIAAWNLEPDALPLGWWVGYHVNDDQQWGRVKNGERLGFSIHGTGTRRELVSA